MFGDFSRSVLYLVAAAGAGGGDDGRVGGIADGGKEDELADLLGKLVVFGLITKGAGHAAAAGGDGLYGIVGGEGEDLCGPCGGGQRLLLAVAMEEDRLCIVCEPVFCDV